MGQKNEWNIFHSFEKKNEWNIFHSFEKNNEWNIFHSFRIPLIWSSTRYSLDENKKKKWVPGIE